VRTALSPEATLRNATGVVDRKIGATTTDGARKRDCNRGACDGRSPNGK